MLSGRGNTFLKYRTCSNIAIRGEGENDLGTWGHDSPLTELSFLQILREMSAFDVIYTAIVISHSGRMMFVGTSVGTIRAMKYPLASQKEFNDYQAHAGPVTKVRGDPLFRGPVPELAVNRSKYPAPHIPFSPHQPPSVFSVS